MAKTTNVTAERFAKGLSYKDYIAQIKVNKDQFDHWYTSFQVKTEDADFFRKAVRHPKGPAKVLVLGEDWCPDVYRGIPTIARVAEVSGMELRIFPRDQNLDIMNEFLNQGQFLSIPTPVFYTKDMQYIAHWIERPALANQERAKIVEEVNKQLASKSDEERRAETRRRTQERFPAWQQASVDEWKALLAPHIK